MLKISLLIATLGTQLLLHSCRSAPPISPYAPQAPTAGESSLALKRSQEAMAIWKQDPKAAEALLREALSLDLFCGQAHNNLGVLFLEQGKLYEAAQEFEWAKKLLPGNPDPRVNLALVLERAGRLEEAYQNYTAALEATPEYLAAIQGAALLACRTQRAEPRLAAWLQRIALSEDPSWASWAKEQLRSGMD
jgi:tetratricopeptide (TPR) repeat protein